jgi:hypothetical protein
MGSDPAARPDERPVRVWRSSWITLIVAIVVAVAAIALFPRSDGGAPPLASLALIGTIVTGIVTAALSVIVRRDLRLPWRAATSLVIAFALIGLVKFVLGPLGLYEVNAVKALDDYLGSVADPVGAAVTAAVVFVLYALGYWIIHRIVGGTARLRSPIRLRRWTLVVGLVGLGLVALSGAWVIALLLLWAPRQYLEFVFSSGAGVLMVVALAGSAALIGLTFRTVEREPPAVADVGAVVSLFWLGLGFLALFHVLWIVYVLVLGSIWPLRTVTPK